MSWARVSDIRVNLLLGVLLWAGCSSRPAPVDAERAGASFPLASGPFTELDVPTDSRDGRAVPSDIPLASEWRDGGVEKGVRSWMTHLPVRTRAMFFLRPPEGMVVLDRDGVELPFGKGPRTWSFDATSLTIHQLASAPAPEPDAYRLRYPFSLAREERLNLTSSGLSKEDFVRATVQVGVESRAGLLLPAPGVAAWEVSVPPAAELHFVPVLVRPEVADGPPSDGVDLRVEVERDGAVTALWEQRVSAETGEPVRVNLSAYEGQSIRLRFRSLPGAHSSFDYAFFADPVVVSRKVSPKRVVMVFVDTLRPDHLGLYGYARDTSKPLDRWAENAVVFEQARSVAPWTLPSQRSVITGREPEAYASAATLPSRLGPRGWATAMFAGNVYLSANFDMERDWALHRADFFPSAAEQVDRALTFLEQQEGRDALVLVHFMDAHLPYHEPLTYRYRYAAAIPPAALGDRFERTKVVQAKLTEPADRAYVVDRYDNNVAYIHDQLDRLLRSLGPEDVVVYYSDHGEEFWDHQQFEHGHTLYDELLRVPLVIRAPGVTGTRVDLPVSLLDIAPTVLDILGVPDPSLDGRSLLGVIRGQADALKDLEQRTIAFGRPLYGSERWGALRGTEKYTTGEGSEAVYDLAIDPGERVNRLREEPLAADRGRTRLAEALGRPVRVGFRVIPGRAPNGAREDLHLEIHVPGGVAAAWVGEDPTRRSAASVQVSGEVVEAVWPKGYSGVREVFFTSNGDPVVVAPQLVVRSGDAGVELRPDGSALPRPGDERSALIRGRVGTRPVTVGWAVAPLPSNAGAAVDGHDAELQDALKAIGYTFDDAPSPSAPAQP